MSPDAKHKALMAARQTPYRAAESPFPIRTNTWIAKERTYPRAGVRQQTDGKWLLIIWFGAALWQVDDKVKTYNTRLAAIKDAQRDVHALRQREHPAGQWHLRGVALEPTA